jgi:hypothetical protein
MCILISYTCPNCDKVTGQCDYVRHTDGQRFLIPDPESKLPHS